MEEQRTSSHGAAAPQPTPEQPQEYGVHLQAKKFIWFAVLLLVIYIAMGLLTRLLPQGAFDRETIDGTEYLVSGSYHLLEGAEPLPVWRWLTIPFEMLATDGISLLLIVLLMMVVSGLIYVLDKGNVIRRMVAWIVRVFGKTRYLMLAVLITVCLALSSTGLLSADELVALTPFMVAIAIGLGWDSLTGVLLCFIPITTGMIGSTVSPYNVVLSQELAGLPLLSGMWLRVLLLLAIWVLTLVFALTYARKIEKRPERSLMYSEDHARRARYSADTLQHIEKKPYPFKEILRDFGKSALEWAIMIPVAMLLFSYSYLLEAGQVMDTIVFRIGGLIAGASPFSAAMLMLLLVMLVELFMPGAMIKAIALMPLLLPLSDITGVSRQLTCFIFITGDALPNVFYPVNTYVLLTMGMIGCRYGKWLRWLWWYLLGLIALVVGAIALAVQLGYA